MRCRHGGSRERRSIPAFPKPADATRAATVRHVLSAEHSVAALDWGVVAGTIVATASMPGECPQCSSVERTTPSMQPGRLEEAAAVGGGDLVVDGAAVAFDT